MCRRKGLERDEIATIARSHLRALHRICPSAIRGPNSSSVFRVCAQPGSTLQHSSKFRDHATEFRVHAPRSFRFNLPGGSGHDGQDQARNAGKNKKQARNQGHFAGHGFVEHEWVREWIRKVIQEHL
jgi:hypothetical protein